MSPCPPDDRRPCSLSVRIDRYERCPSPVRHHHHRHYEQPSQQQQQQQQLKPSTDAAAYYHCVWHADDAADDADGDDAMRVPVVVCEDESSSCAAAAADNDPHPAAQPRPAGTGCSDVMAASSDVTTPDHEQLRHHRGSWPEDAFAEHLTEMRSC